MKTKPKSSTPYKYIMNKNRKYLLLCSLMAILSFSYHYFSHWQKERTGGFTLSKITSSLAFNPDWAVSSLDLDEQRELASALSQDYTYLGAGGQCFAFVSKDSKYVVKFFKNYRRRAPFYASFPMPGSLKCKVESKVQRKLAKLKRDFTSYKIAFEELRQETGLIFVHLNKTKNLRKTLTVTDKAGRVFTIDLDSKEFVIQKKADLIYPSLQAYREKGEKESAQKLVSSVLSLIVDRSKKGIFDEDAQIYRNFGCVNEKALLIDAGRLRKNDSIRDPLVYVQNIHQITEPFLKWLEKNYPELKSPFEEEIHALEKDCLSL